MPYNHHNVDSDEMLFYTGGNYEARRGSGIEQGSISLHPSGFTHGPQPGAAERSIGADFFDELAVMVDTFRPLDLCDAARWRARTPATPGPGPAAPDRPTGTALDARAGGGDQGGRDRPRRPRGWRRSGWPGPPRRWRPPAATG